MENDAKYEYRVWRDDDDRQQVDDNMKRFAEAGWELVSGTAVPFVVSEVVAGMGGRPDIWHTGYVTYWRKPISRLGASASL